MEWSGEPFDKRTGRAPTLSPPCSNANDAQGSENVAAQAKQGASNEHRLSPRPAAGASWQGLETHLESHRFKAVPNMIPHATTKQGKPGRSKDCHTTAESAAGRLKPWPMKQRHHPSCSRIEQYAVRDTGRCRERWRRLSMEGGGV